MKGKTVGFAMCGSFCTLAAAIAQLQPLKEAGASLLPILSPITATCDTRFGRAQDFMMRIEAVCDQPIVRTIEQAEPIGPKNLLDLLIIAPCTGNTLGKLANGITDTPVLMAAKAHLRNDRPLLIAMATNDALGAAAKNIGLLLNSKHIYFVPFRQDDPDAKHNSLISEFGLILPAAYAALEGRQLQPILLPAAQRK